jgi:hypothetical protein
MKFHSTMKMAEDTLLAVKRLLRSHKGTVVIHAYSNGQENGYCLTNYSLGDKSAVASKIRNPTAAFSEHRSSDKIVVMCGDAIDFMDGGCIPTDKVFNSARFLFDTPEKAAKHIASYLISGRLENNK